MIIASSWSDALDIRLGSDLSSSDGWTGLWNEFWTDRSRDDDHFQPLSPRPSLVSRLATVKDRNGNGNWKRKWKLETELETGNGRQIFMLQPGVSTLHV